MCNYNTFWNSMKIYFSDWNGLVNIFLACHSFEIFLKLSRVIKYFRNGDMWTNMFKADGCAITLSIGINKQMFHEIYDPITNNHES